MRYHSATFEIRVYETGFLVSLDAMVHGVRVSVFREVAFDLVVTMKATDFHYLTAIMSEELEQKVRRLGG